MVGVERDGGGMGGGRGCVWWRGVHGGRGSMCGGNVHAWGMYGGGGGGMHGGWACVVVGGMHAQENLCGDCIMEKVTLADIGYMSTYVRSFLQSEFHDGAQPQHPIICTKPMDS